MEELVSNLKVVQKFPFLVKHNRIFSKAVKCHYNILLYIILVYSIFKLSRNYLKYGHLETLILSNVCYKALIYNVRQN